MKMLERMLGMRPGHPLNKNFLIAIGVLTILYATVLGALLVERHHLTNKVQILQGPGPVRLSVFSDTGKVIGECEIRTPDEPVTVFLRREP